MPTYTVTSPAGLLDDAKKAALARTITDAHADITGAPAYFAQVVFFDQPRSGLFMGGRPLRHDHVFIFGHIRDGRSAVDRKALIRHLAGDAARAAALPATSIWVYLHELPAAAMVEFGHILPPAGEEADWAEALPAADRAFMDSLSEG